MLALRTFPNIYCSVGLPEPPTALLRAFCKKLSDVDTFYFLNLDGLAWICYRLLKNFWDQKPLVLQTLLMMFTGASVDQRIEAKILCKGCSQQQQAFSEVVRVGLPHQLQSLLGLFYDDDPMAHPERALYNSAALWPNDFKIGETELLGRDSVRTYFLDLDPENLKEKRASTPAIRKSYTGKWELTPHILWNRVCTLLLSRYGLDVDEYINSQEITQKRLIHDDQTDFMFHLEFLIIPSLDPSWHELYSNHVNPQLYRSVVSSVLVEGDGEVFCDQDFIPVEARSSVKSDYSELDRLQTDYNDAMLRHSADGMLRNPADGMIALSNEPFYAQEHSPNLSDIYQYSMFTNSFPKMATKSENDIYTNPGDHLPFTYWGDPYSTDDICDPQKSILATLSSQLGAGVDDEPPADPPADLPADPPVFRAAPIVLGSEIYEPNVVSEVCEDSTPKTTTSKKRRRCQSPLKKRSTPLPGTKVKIYKIDPAARRWNLLQRR